MRKIAAIAIAFASLVSIGNVADADSRHEDRGGWDADSQGNRRYDPDLFDPTVDGNGIVDPGGIPVNGTEAPHHPGLPCYLDFPEFDSMTGGVRFLAWHYMQKQDPDTQFCN